MGNALLVMEKAGMLFVMVVETFLQHKNVASAIIVEDVNLAMGIEVIMKSNYNIVELGRLIN